MELLSIIASGMICLYRPEYTERKAVCCLGIGMGLGQRGKKLHLTNLKLVRRIGLSNSSHCAIVLKNEINYNLLIIINKTLKKLQTSVFVFQRIKILILSSIKTKVFDIFQNLSIYTYIRICFKAE